MAKNKLDGWELAASLASVREPRPGFCFCGCGGVVPVATKSDARYSQVKGEPIRYLRGHHRRRPGAGARRGAIVTMQRLTNRVQVIGGHWVWNGGMEWRGNYGRPVFRPRGSRESEPAARVAYSLMVAPLADSVQLGKVCRKPACVNPAHHRPKSPRR